MIALPGSSVGERMRLEEVGLCSAEHLSFEHFDAIDAAFDRSGAVRQGEAVGDGVPFVAEPAGEAT